MRTAIRLLFVLLAFALQFKALAQKNILDSLTNLQRTEISDSTRCKVYIELGDFYKQINKDSSLNYYKRSLDLAKRNKLVRYQILANQSLGTFFLLMAEYDSAFVCFNSSLELNSRLQEEGFNYKIFSSIGMYYHYTTSYDSAEIYYLKAMESAHKTGNKFDLADSYNKTGSLNSDRGNYTKAIDCFTQAIAISKEIGDEKGLSRYYNNISIVYLRQGNYSQSLEFALIALKLLEKQNYLHGVASCLINIGNIYNNQKDYDQAITSFQKALAIHTKLDNKKNIFDCLNNIGIAYQNKGMPDSVGYYYLKAIEIAKQIDYLNGVSIVYNNFASLLTDQKKYNDAIDYYQKAIEIAYELDDKNSIAVRYLNLSLLYIKKAQQATNNYKSAYLQDALKYANKGADMSHKLNSTWLLNEEASVYMQLYAEMGNYKKAFEYSNKYISSRDSMYSDEKTQAIANAEKRFESEKKQLEIDKLNNEKQLQQLELIRQQEKARNERIILLMVIGLITLTSGFIIYIRKRRRDLFYQKQMAYITQLRMISVRNRMSPHFFFNALGSMNALAVEPELLQKKIQDLSVLLRKTIEKIDQVALPLEEELDIVEAYVDLYKEKFSGHLNFKITIEEGVDLKNYIPSMIVQIPVENALKHGLMPLESDDRELGIRVTQNEGIIAIDVADNGVGFTNNHSTTMGTGTGLKSMMQTIHLLNSSNKEKISLKLVSREQDVPGLKGVRTEIRVPVKYIYTN